MRLLKIYLFALLISSNHILVAQVDAAEGEAPSTVQQLLELVKEGQVREQSENALREAEFMANKNKQASILAAEKRELARQERIADQLEAEYKKNEEILRVKEEAYKKELGSEDAFDRVLDGEHRGLVKSAFNAMIQASSNLRNCPSDINPLIADMSWGELRDRIIEAHKPIEHFLLRHRQSDAV